MNAFFLATLLFLSLAHTVIAQSITDRFQNILDTTYTKNADALGVLVHVESPDKHISWTAAVGFSNKNTKQKIDKNQPVLIASNTKTYVAAAVLKLVETGKVKLEMPIDQIIRKETRILLIEDGYNLEKITVRNLLSHTSGITDYVDQSYFEFVNEHPDHQWSRDEQIQRAVKIGAPIAEAGEQFKYGDINYLLLTEIIEQQIHTPFYAAIRELLDYSEHQLEATWFIDLEEMPKDALPLAHQYWNKYNWDSYDLNPSWDLYGGGGLAATTKDAALFFQHLFEGKIIKDTALLSQLHTFVLPKEVSNYCLGLRNISFHGTTGYYHGGFWGTDVMYFPDINTTISVFTLQRDYRDINAQLHHDILQLLKE